MKVMAFGMFVVITTRNLAYTYDRLYRLTGESWTGQSYTYTYDDAGNRLTKVSTTGGNATTTTYTYDDLNRLLSHTSGGGGNTYQYDLNGNRASKSDGAGVTTYGYDTLNRLTSADKNGSQVFEAEFDYRTRRVAKTEGGDTTLYRYDGGVSFQEVDDTGNVNVEFVRGSGMGGGIGSILYSDRDPSGGGGGGGGVGALTREYFTYNAVGHTVALTDTLGNVSKSTTYEAFGNEVASTGTSANNRLANTKERDASIGLDNHGYRYYDPSNGRYTTRDPIGYGDGLNNYLSVHDNPVNHVDPLGLETFQIEEGGFKLVEHPTEPTWLIAMPLEETSSRTAPAETLRRQRLAVERMLMEEGMVDPTVQESFLNDRVGEGQVEVGAGKVLVDETVNGGVAEATSPMNVIPGGPVAKLAGKLGRKLGPLVKKAGGRTLDSVLGLLRRSKGAAGEAGGDQLREQAEEIMARSRRLRGEHPGVLDMAKKPDLRQTDEIAKEFDLSPAQQRALHEEIQGGRFEGGHNDFDLDEIREIARDISENQSQRQ